MKVNNKEYSLADISRYSADHGSLFGVRRYTLEEGRGKGLSIIEARTAAGLVALFSADRALDILQLTYKGVNIGFMSKDGAVSYPYNHNFHQHFAGGMLTTCGSLNAGIASGGQPMHGVLQTLPAQEICASAGGEFITISGKMYESALFGANMCLERKIIIPSDGSYVEINDTLTNNTPLEEKCIMLYHFNFGFPFLDEGLKLNIPGRKPLERDGYDESTMTPFEAFTPPQDGIGEECYFHNVPGGRPIIRLTNDALGISAALSYDKAALPYLVQWKSLGSTDYALGLEPSTGLLYGREKEIERGLAKKVAPFSSLRFNLRLTLEG